MTAITYAETAAWRARFREIADGPMTVALATEAVALIESMGVGYGDSEAAHCMEDQLREAALHCAAAGGVDAAEICRIALSTDALAFSRWYA